MMPKPEVAGQCGCGRSPTGRCIGWHVLTEEGYMDKLNAYLREVAEEEKDHTFDTGSID
jgi:hypothetical protein